MKGLLQHLRELGGTHPLDQLFLDRIADRIRERCQAVPTHAHSRIGAEHAIEAAAKAAIVEVFQEEFPNAIKPLVVTKKWPFAECWIVEDEALIKYSFSPETDHLMGGIACDPIRIVIHRAPRSLMQRLKDDLLRRKQNPELAPVGTPDGRPELKLEATPPPRATPAPRAALPTAPKRPEPEKRPKRTL